MPIKQFSETQNEVSALKGTIKQLKSALDYMNMAVTEVEKERDEYADLLKVTEVERDALTDVFDAATNDYRALTEHVRSIVSDLRTLPEVPLNELEDSIEAVIVRLKGAL